MVSSVSKYHLVLGAGHWHRKATPRGDLLSAQCLDDDMEDGSETAVKQTLAELPSSPSARELLPQRAVKCLWDMLKEQVRYRELLFTLASRDIRTRYKHSLIGVGWALFVPVILMVVFGTVLGKVAKIDTGDIPHPIFIYCGLVPWWFFQQSVVRGTQSLVINRNLVTKIYFAREVLPFAAILTAGFDFLIASTVLAGMMIWFKVPPESTIALVPLVLLIQLILSAGVVLALSMVNLFYRDVGQVISVMMMAWMFVTAVVYPIPDTGGWRVLNTLNPMTPIIVSYRDLILRGVLPDWGNLGAAAGISVALFAIAWTVFHTSEFRFAENV